MDITELPVIRLRMIKDFTLQISDKEIYTANEAAPIFYDLIGESTLEKIAMICLDCNHKVVNAAIINIGTHKEVSIVPSEVFRIAILSNSYSIFICHNHPSGNIKASKYDLEITKKIGYIGNILGIKLVDSLIIGDYGKYLSIRTELKKESDNNDK